MIFPLITSLRQGSGWQARINADKTILLGSISATISEIRGEFRDQTFEQKVTKRTKRVICDENGSSLPSFPYVKVRNDRLVGMTPFSLFPPVNFCSSC